MDELEDVDGMPREQGTGVDSLGSPDSPRVHFVSSLGILGAFESQSLAFFTNNSIARTAASFLVICGYVKLLQDAQAGLSHSGLPQPSVSWK